MRKYKRDKEEKLSDGGTAGGRGRLADAVVDIFQNYYGAAIRNERGSKNKLKDAIWTINYHCILCENEPLLQQHCLCSNGRVLHGADINVTKQIKQSPIVTCQFKCLPLTFRTKLNYAKRS